MTGEGVKKKPRSRECKSCSDEEEMLLLLCSVPPEKLSLYRKIEEKTDNMLQNHIEVTYTSHDNSSPEGCVVCTQEDKRKREEKLG